MDFISLILLGIGLSFDTFAVSISCGIMACEIKFKQAARIATYFAVFQAIMPVLGYAIGYAIRDYVSAYDHWLAFGLLAIIGSKMIYEGFKDEEERCFNPFKLKVILMMALATTIDAFVVGVTFAFIKVNIVQASIIIGIITFLAAMLGMLFGKKVGSRFGKKMEYAGGGILILIGLKILLTHCGII